MTQCSCFKHDAFRLITQFLNCFVKKKIVTDSRHIENFNYVKNDCLGLHRTKSVVAAACDRV